MDSIATPSRVIYSCYTKLSRTGENFIADHVFTHIKSGSLIINDGKNEHLLKEGDFALYIRNNLAKFTKIPGSNGDFKALSVLLDQPVLMDISKKFNVYKKEESVTGSIIPLKNNRLYESYSDSLIAYLENTEHHSDTLLNLKVNEAAMLLLETQPGLSNTLLNFTIPGKIDLEAFMQRNFHFNVGINRFAYLTGRSISTFKRDFEKIFGDTPARWLQQKRLEEAYYLISKKGHKASDVYIEVGFENLSHFSFAFKKAFGKPPSQLTISI